MFDRKPQKNRLRKKLCRSAAQESFHTKTLPKNSVGKLVSKQIKNYPAKTILQRSCLNHRRKNATEKRAHLNGCQTIAIQTGCQKHCQPLKSRKVGIDVFLRKAPQKCSPKDRYAAAIKKSMSIRSLKKNRTKMLPKTHVIFRYQKNCVDLLVKWYRTKVLRRTPPELQLREKTASKCSSEK